MSVEFYWYMKLDRLAKFVTKPSPWVDSSGIAEYGDLIREHMKSMAAKAERLQEDGWALKLSTGTIHAIHHKYTSEQEVIQSLESCCINPKEVTIYTKNHKYDYDSFYGI
jgi:hypothetical protein